VIVVTILPLNFGLCCCFFPAFLIKKITHFDEERSLRVEWMAADLNGFVHQYLNFRGDFVQRKYTQKYVNVDYWWESFPGENPD
jgi:hypothetical protein